MAGVLTHAFPSSARVAAEKVVALLPPASLGPAAGFVVSVEGESVEIPARIYSAELPNNQATELAPIERTVYGCLYTRHHDGQTRQRYLQSILGKTDAFVAPFVVKLIGEYVIEIVLDIQRGLTDLENPESTQHDQYARFVTDNPHFIEATSARVALEPLLPVGLSSSERLPRLPAHHFAEASCRLGYLAEVSGVIPEHSRRSEAS